MPGTSEMYCCLSFNDTVTHLYPLSLVVTVQLVAHWYPSALIDIVIVTIWHLKPFSKSYQVGEWHELTTNPLVSTFDIHFKLLVVSFVLMGQLWNAGEQSIWVNWTYVTSNWLKLMSKAIVCNFNVLFLKIFCDLSKFDVSAFVRHCYLQMPKKPSESGSDFQPLGKKLIQG